MSKFPAILSELRKERSLTQRELARILDLSPSTISMYENGNREPDYETLKKFAFYFDCSVDYLLGTVPFGRHYVFDEMPRDRDWSGRPLTDQHKDVNSELTLSPEEQTIIRCYRIASADDRAMVDLALKKYRENPAASDTKAV